MPPKGRGLTPTPKPTPKPTKPASSPGTFEPGAGFVPAKPHVTMPTNQAPYKSGQSPHQKTVKALGKTGQVVIDKPKGLPNEYGAQQHAQTLATQRMLRAQGFDIKADGVWGPKTESAYQAYLHHTSRVAAARAQQTRFGAEITPQSVDALQAVKTKATYAYTPYFAGQKPTALLHGKPYYANPDAGSHGFGALGQVAKGIVIPVVNLAGAIGTDIIEPAAQGFQKVLPGYTRENQAHTALAQQTPGDVRNIPGQIHDITGDPYSAAKGLVKASYKFGYNPSWSQAANVAGNAVNLALWALPATKEADVALKAVGESLGLSGLTKREITDSFAQAAARPLDLPVRDQIAQAMDSSRNLTPAQTAYNLHLYDAAAYAQAARDGTTPEQAYMKLWNDAVHAPTMGVGDNVSNAAKINQDIAGNPKALGGVIRDPNTLTHQLILTNRSNASTPAHELWHAIQPNLTPEMQEAIQAAYDASGAADRGQNIDEFGARNFEAWLSEAHAPTPAMQSFLDKIAPDIHDVYAQSGGVPPTSALSNEMRAVFNQVFTKTEPSRLAKAMNWEGVGQAKAELGAAIKGFPKDYANTWKDIIKGDGENSFLQEASPHELPPDEKPGALNRAAGRLIRDHGAAHLPPGSDSTRAMTGLLRDLRQRAIDGWDYRKWYSKSADAILNFTNHNLVEAKKVAALLAVYSPRAEVFSAKSEWNNLDRAINAYDEYKRTGEISNKWSISSHRTGEGDWQTYRATQIMQGKYEWDGLKTNRFFRNFFQHINPAEYAAEYGHDPINTTQDTWMRRAFKYAVKLNKKGEKDEPISDGMYSFMDAATREVAKSLGIAPEEAQAAIWTSIKSEMEGTSLRKAGGSFEEALATRAKRQAKGVNLKGLPEGRFSNDDAQGVAKDYMDKAALDYKPPLTYASVDPERAAKIADWYDKAESAPNDPAVRAAYDAMARETLSQYHEIVANGYTFEFYPEGHDPYPVGPEQAMTDLRDNKHMYVYPTEEGYGVGGITDELRATHPLLGDSGVKWGGKTAMHNDIFRAVHDFFGHFKEGVGFRAGGEENAWRSHVSMYSDEAKPAMTSETRGQNSWVNYGPHGAENRTASQAATVYADQKAVLAPDWIVHEGSGVNEVAQATIDQAWGQVAKAMGEKVPKSGILRNQKVLARASEFLAHAKARGDMTPELQSIADTLEAAEASLKDGPKSWLDDPFLHDIGGAQGLLLKQEEDLPVFGHEPGDVSDQAKEIARHLPEDQWPAWVKNQIHDAIHGPNKPVSWEPYQPKGGYDVPDTLPEDWTHLQEADPYDGESHWQGSAASLADMHGVDIAKVPPTGEGGRVTVGDVEKYVFQQMPPADQLKSLLKGLSIQRGKQEAGYSAERAKRFGNVRAALANENLSNEEARAAAGDAMRGELPKVIVNGHARDMTQETLDTLVSQVRYHPTLSDGQKIRVWDAINDLVHEGRTPQKSELALMRHVWGKGTTMSLVEEISKWHKLGRNLTDILNVPRSIMSSMDVSFGLRQALVAATYNPGIWFKAWKGQFALLGKWTEAAGAEQGGEAAYKALMEHIYDSPNFPMYQQMKLAITDMEHALGLREEGFQSNLAEKFTGGVHSPIRGSGRAYTGMAIKLRTELADRLLADAAASGQDVHDEQFLEELGHFINGITGRGKFPAKALEEGSPLLSAIFFSPRLMASRLQMLNPVHYITGNAFVRKQYIKAGLRFYGTMATVLAAIKYFVPGASVTFNPRSSDFGKIKLGNNRIDAGGGFNQFMHLFGMIATGEKQNTTTGQVTKLGGGKFGQETRADAFIKFMEGKLSPTSSIVKDWASDSDPKHIGRGFNTLDEATSHLTPLIAQDAWQVYNDPSGTGLNGIAAAVAGYGLESTGVGLQNFGPSQPGAKTLKKLNDEAKATHTPIPPKVEQGMKNLAQLKSYTASYQGDPKGAMEQYIKFYATQTGDHSIDKYATLATTPEMQKRVMAAIRARLDNGAARYEAAIKARAAAKGIK